MRARCAAAREENEEELAPAEVEAKEKDEANAARPGGSEEREGEEAGPLFLLFASPLPSLAVPSLSLLLLTTFASSPVLAAPTALRTFAADAVDCERPSTATGGATKSVLGRSLATVTSEYSGTASYSERSHSAVPTARATDASSTIRAVTKPLKDSITAMLK